MKHIHTFLICLAATALPAFAQNKNLPPIPVSREMVEAEVEQQRAYILTPEQIELLKKDATAARKANISPYPNGVIAKPVSRTMEIDPDIAQQPRLLRLSAGMISTIVFSDRNGNPWLIKSVSFDCSQFEDGASCQSAGKAATGKAVPTNILKIQPITPVAYGNIVIELEDVTSPVNFMLAAGQSDETDITISARVAGRNPNAKPQAITLDRMPEHDNLLIDFLNGVAPSGAMRLAVAGGAAEAWQFQGALYIRTRLVILSPAFKDHAGSADGIHVYKYQSVFSQLLASSSGVTTTLQVSGF